jgi:hypothetical protein
MGVGYALCGMQKCLEVILLLRPSYSDGVEQSDDVHLNSNSSLNFARTEY